MSAVIPFLRPAARTDSWSPQELAEFYRVEAALQRAGIGIASDHGVSDEGEPWFVFCRPDGEAIMHFARTDGSYLIASDALAHPVRGADFRALIDQIARLHPHLLPIPALVSGTKLVVHPAALLAALVAAAALSLSSGEAHASEFESGVEPLSGHPMPGGGGAAHGPAQPARARDTAGSSDRDDGRKQIEAIILSTMIFAAEAVVGDHDAKGADLGSLLTDLAGGAGPSPGQAETATTAVGGAESGAGGGGAIQPAVLTAQGSGTGQTSTAPSGPGDLASGIRFDSAHDKGGLPSREVDHQGAGPGDEAAPFHATADAGGAVGTAGPQTSATGHVDASTGSSTASGSSAGDPRAAAITAPGAEASPPLKLAEPTPGEAGTDPSSHGRGPVVRQAEASPAAAASYSQESDPVGHSGSGKKADAVAPDSAADEGPDEGHGRALGRESHTASAEPDGPGSGGDGPAHAKGGPGPQTDGPDKAAPSPSDDHRGPATPHAQSSDAGPGASADGTGKGHGQEHAQAHGQEQGHGQGQGNGQGHDGPSPPAAASVEQGGPEGAFNADRSHGPSQEHGPGTSSASGNAHAAAPSPNSHPAHPADATGPAAPQEHAGSPPHPGAHPGPTDAASEPEVGPTAHRPNPGSGDHGQAAHESTGPGAPGHSGAASPAHPAAQVGADASAPSHPDAGPPADDAPLSSRGGPNATDHPTLGSPRQDPASPADSSREHAGQQAAAPPSQGHQEPVGTGPGPSVPPRASVDPNGNLVFHGGPHQADTAPPPSHGPGDTAAHPSIGLVGIADHGPVVHDLYHHG